MAATSSSYRYHSLPSTDWTESDEMGEQNTSHWKKSRLTAYTFTCAAFATIGSLLYGIDNGIISTTIAHDSFREYFAPFTPDVSGAVVSTFAGGSFVGVVCAGWMADHWGRKRTIQFAALWALLSGAIQAGSVHISMFIIGRVVGGFAVGILNMVVPIYNAEIAPPRWRGVISGLHAQSVSCGFAASNWIGYGFSYVSGQIQWRLPLAIQCLPAIILLLGIHILPFSPRWLLEKGKKEEAWLVYQKLNEAGGTYSLNAQHRDFNEMCHQIEAAQEGQIADASFSSMFQKPAYHRRLLLAVIVNLFAQLTGVSVINYFQTDLYRGIGITGRSVLLLAGIYGSIGPVSNIICLTYVDRSGRKFALWLTSFLLACDLTVVMLLTKTYGGEGGSKDGKAATVGLIFLFSALFSLGYNSIQVIYLPEILSQPIRAKGSAFSICISLLANIVLNQISPRAFAAIGYKYYTVFIAFNILGAFLVYTLFVETKGKTLEEIGLLFGDKLDQPSQNDISDEE